jgi:mono/diheme cytochrome c family protein
MRKGAAVGRTNRIRFSRIVQLILGGLCLVSLPGCEKAMRNMYEQPKYGPLEPSSLWPDGQSARPLEPGVIVASAGALAASSSGRQGDLALPDWAEGATAHDAGGVMVPAARMQPVRTPPPMTIESLRRGRERYDIYCTPCHSVSGDGDGMVVRRGFPAPASLHSPLMRAASDAHLFDVITSGYGVMYPFADRISPPDRWAIVAYVRALQRSQHASIKDVPKTEQPALLKETP